MITLITGTPGTGKTAYLLKLLLELGKDRVIYTYGIPGLMLPHEEIPDPTLWYDYAADGNIICLDECQQVWRPTGAGTAIPKHITQLEIARHSGLDFYIITQGPHLIHANVRALVGRHIHIRDLGILGRRTYEWAECKDNCRTAFRSAMIIRRYKLPKKVFDLYTSASVHAKPKRDIPPWLWLGVAAVIGLCIILYRLYARNVELSPPSSPSTSTSSKSLPADIKSIANSPSNVDERVDFLPRIRGRPWTSPAYDQLRVVVAIPNITSAICVNDDCKCFNGYSRLDISSEDCKVWSIDRPFNPYVVSATASGNTSYQQSNTQPASPSPSVRPSEVLSSVSPL